MVVTWLSLRGDLCVLVKYSCGRLGFGEKLPFWKLWSRILSPSRPDIFSFSMPVHSLTPQSTHIKFLWPEKPARGVVPVLARCFCVCTRSDREQKRLSNFRSAPLKHRSHLLTQQHENKHHGSSPSHGDHLSGWRMKEKRVKVSHSVFMSSGVPLRYSGSVSLRYRHFLLDRGIGLTRPIQIRYSA